AQLRRQGRFRIARELRARGVPDRIIQAALENAFDETDEVSLLRTRLKKRLARIPGELDQRKLASLYRNLMAAGFSSELIRTELRAMTKKEGADLPDVSAEDG
ncbi:MAG: RecX family transcriptional regulator, partial [Candidatus Acidiferrales bacterium]